MRGIVTLEFLVLVFSVLLGLFVYKRLNRSPKFNEIVTEIVEPPAEASVIADIHVAEANARRQVRVNQRKATQAEKSTDKISRARKRLGE